MLIFPLQHMHTNNHGIRTHLLYISCVRLCILRLACDAPQKDMTCHSYLRLGSFAHYFLIVQVRKIIGLNFSHSLTTLLRQSLFRHWVEDIRLHWCILWVPETKIKSHSLIWYLSIARHFSKMWMSKRGEWREGGRDERKKKLVSFDKSEHVLVITSITSFFYTRKKKL